VRPISRIRVSIRSHPTSTNSSDLLDPPELRFGGNALERRTFWTSTGETPKYDEKVTVTPDVYDGAGMEAFAESDAKEKTAISQYWYQLYECDSNKVPGRGSKAENLIDPLAKKSAKKNLGIGMDKAEASDLPLWLEETGPTSCPGTNDTSLTTASALWATDYTFYTANFGAERMAMHSKVGGCEAGHRCRRSAIRRQPAEPDNAEGILSRPSLAGLWPVE